MPALVLLGRKWLIGSDDMVFPALFEILVRVIWLILISVVCSRYYSWTFNCVSGGILVRAYLIGMLAVLSLVIFVLVLLVNRSAQGAIWDTEARRLVGPLLIIKMLLIGPEIAMNVLGTMWAFTDYIQCDDEEFTSTAIEIVVLFNWALFALTVFGLVLLMDPLGSKRLDEQTDSTADTLRHKKVTRVWVRRFRWFFCWIMRDEHSHEAFAQAAGLFSSLFRGTDIIPTDFIAGCILLRVKQKRECREQRRLALIAEQRYKCTSDIKELLMDKPSWMCMKKAQHYMKLSMASYGWLFVIYRHCCTGIFKLFPRLMCCSCFRAKPTIVKGDNCCLCNLAGVRYMSHLQPKDILYASFRNHIFELPFCVLADHKTSSILICIRGSLSMRDIFTDLTATPEKFHVEGLPTGSLAHKGMLSSAKYIKKELEDYGVLDKAYAIYPEYKLVITGHSLGAGTGTLLGCMLRPKFPDVKVYGFSCPGGMVSKELAKYCEDFVFSIGIGDDLVMRVGIDSVEDLRTNMMHVLHACRLPKYRIFLNGFGYAFFGVPSRDLESTWKSDRIRTPVFSTRDRHSPLLTNGGPSTSYDITPIHPQHEVVSRRFCKTRLYMPGNIVHVTRKKKTKEERKAAKKLKVLNGDDFEMRWATCEDFLEMRIMPRMLLDHLPENVFKTLNAIMECQQTEIGMDMPEITVI
ncbi:diacylglycerol lipase-beta [Planococcus citri]|uniref:diacylglycerol lipase-beta n=1 Tax=Planococcus citri TaxID=170843 RepID=UPI0031F812E6